MTPIDAACIGYFLISSIFNFAEIDIVISGGGFKGYLMTGCASILRHELNKRNIRVGRIAGARSSLRFPTNILYNCPWDFLFVQCGFVDGAVLLHSSEHRALDRNGVRLQGDEQFDHS